MRCLLLVGRVEAQCRLLVPGQKHALPLPERLTVPVCAASLLSNEYLLSVVCLDEALDRRADDHCRNDFTREPVAAPGHTDPLGAHGDVGAVPLDEVRLAD